MRSCRPALRQFAGSRISERDLATQCRMSVTGGCDLQNHLLPHSARSVKHLTGRRMSWCSAQCLAIMRNSHFQCPQVRQRHTSINKGRSDVSGKVVSTCKNHCTVPSAGSTACDRHNVVKFWLLHLRPIYIHVTDVTTTQTVMNIESLKHYRHGPGGRCRRLVNSANSPPSSAAHSGSR